LKRAASSASKIVQGDDGNDHVVYQTLIDNLIELVVDGGLTAWELPVL
jgi:hypothetical protein